jgi:hypothetical protein
MDHGPRCYDCPRQAANPASPAAGITSYGRRARDCEVTNHPPGTAPDQGKNDPAYTQSKLTGRFNTTTNMTLYKKILINYKILILIHFYLWIKIVQFNNNPTNKAL